jgi:hypothetical protein
MTVIRPNSVSGINSITAQANEIKIFKSDGTQGGLVIGGANLNATSGISTVAALTVTGNVSVGGTLTYQDVTNIDSVGVITARAGVHVTGGNVAVGHNNPSVNLHVKGSASNGQIYLGGTGAHSQIYADNDGVLILNADQGNSAANSYLGFNVDNSERLRIDSSGRLLVGHNSSRSSANALEPHFQMEGINVSTSTAAIVRNENAANGPILGLSKSRGTSTGSNTIVQSGDITGAIHFAGADGTDLNSFTAWIQSEVDGTPGSNDMPGRLTFYTTATGASSPTERLRIDSTGRVGINTSTFPEARDSLIVAPPSGQTDAFFSIKTLSTNGQTRLHFADPDDTNVGDISYTHSNNAMVFKTADIERLRITGSGYVGIGSDNPTGRLDIQDNFENRFAIRFVNTMGTGRTYGFRSHGSNGEALTLYHGSIRLQQWDDYQAGGNTVFYSGGNESFRINSDGNISIGGHSSNYANSPLEVRGTNAGGDVAIRVTNNSTTAGTQAGIIFTTTTADYTTAGIAFERGGTADALRFYVGQSAGGGGFTNATERLRITSGGDLLLGGQTAYTYDDTGASNTILDITNSTNNKRGILSLSGNSNANGPSIGTIWFNNDQNSGTGPGGTMKLVAAIQAKAVTSDSNAGDDSGAYLQFLTKPESAALAESMVIHSDGEVTKVKQPGFFARRSVAGDGRAAGAQEWSVSGTGTFNTGSHFNTSNGRFTAPIAGRYLFTAAPGYKQTGQNFQFYFRINGGDASESVRFIDGGDDLTSHSTAAGSVIYNLSANDYVDVYVGVTHHTNVTTNYFMGYLLG